ncbi:hypothetical protein RRG08_052636 [Elysia crispata]|uniref:Cytochrome P450 n=1 Tax=Elysia crispata TaxID=231223 RepID=A0AAE1DYI5_9GAST|nr:hypothetical protein RRG08_052636 [Elysia crispata]
MRAGLIFSVCIVASFLMLSEKLNVDAWICLDLKRCIKDLRLYSTFFFRPDAISGSELSWSNSWKNACRNIRIKTECTIKNACKYVHPLQMQARYLRKLTRSLCKPEGKEFVRRFFTQSNSSCLGNMTAFQLLRKHKKACFWEHFVYSNFTDLTHSEQCTQLNIERNCEADYAASICTDLYRWYVDMSWEIFVQVYYKYCKGTFTPPLYKLPGSRPVAYWRIKMASEPSQKIEVWTSQTLTYVALTLGLIALIKYLLTSRPPANIPPFPARAYPFMGHLPYFRNGLRKQLEEWTKSTGEIFSLYFGGQLVVILSSYDAVYQAFVKHGDTLSDRPKSLAVDVDGDDPDKGLALSSGRVWKEQRTVTIQILRSFGFGKNILASKVIEEVSAYLTALSELSGQPSDVSGLTQTAVANVICSIIVGKRFEYDDASFVTFVKKLNRLFQLCESSSLFTVFPWLRYLPGDLFNAKERTGIYRYIMNLFCYHYIDKAKQECDDFAESFITSYLREMKKLEKAAQDTTLDDENLARNLLALFLAGTNTTSTTLQWFMLHMLHYPDVQAQVFAEISDVIGFERPPNMNDKQKLNYTNAAILESHRMGSTPLSLPHECSEDTVVKGYTIPAGATVISNLDAMLFYDDVWKDPKAFKPERFLDAKGNFSQPDQFIPFGIGRRACPGESLARMEQFLVATSVIQRFELQPAVPGQLPTLKPIEGMIFSPQPFQIRFVDRRGL